MLVAHNYGGDLSSCEREGCGVSYPRICINRLPARQTSSPKESVISTTTGTAARDYSGVATSQLSEVYHRYTTYSDIGLFAEKIGMDERNLKKILVMQEWPFTGLHRADCILLGIGLNISSLVRTGEITIIPADAKWKAAERMADDAQWVLQVSGSSAMTDLEKQALIDSLKELRAHCLPSNKQRARADLDLDAAQAKDRQVLR